MELFENTVDRFASPLILYSAALLLIIAAARNRFLLKRWAGIVLLVLTAAFLAVGLADAGFRDLVLDPARLPALVWWLLSLAVLWLALYRAPQAPPEPAEGTADGTLAGDAPVVVWAGVALMACAFFLEPPLGSSAVGLSAGSSAVPAVDMPWFLSGFQELRFYFDPWMAHFGLPALFVAALLALPYLDGTPAGEDDPAGERRRLMTFAAAVLLLVLLPVLVATFLRGPHWNAFGPFEVRDAAHPRPIPAFPLSEVFWCRWLGRSAPPSSWPLRELPGGLLLAGYFLFLPWVLARWSATRRPLGRYRQAVGPWRYRLALALGLALAIVPLKMYGRWLFDIGLWLTLPELSLNF